MIRDCDGSIDSRSLGGDGPGPKYAGSGCGVDGPMNESESIVESSEGGACDEDPLLVRTLSHMKRCVPVVASGPWIDSNVETDGFLPSASVATEACLEGSGIKPWQASVGVGGTLCRFCRLGFLFPFGEPFWCSGWVLSSLLNP